MNGEDEMDHYTNFNVFLVATQCLLWYAYSMYSSIKETCRYLGPSGGSTKPKQIQADPIYTSRR